MPADGVLAVLADICQDSQEAFYYLGMQAYNVVILDRMLPGMDGIQILQRMRQKGIATPVIMVTALGTIEDRIAVRTGRAVCQNPGTGTAAGTDGV